MSIVEIRNSFYWSDNVLFVECVSTVVLRRESRNTETIRDMDLKRSSELFV